MPVLDWIGKKAVVNHHREVPYRLVHCDGERSAGDPDAGNLLVQGDNLEALKALLPYYAGKVKCIYIDPPYNTGNEGWVYNDNVASPEIKAWLGKVVGKEAEDLSRHDKWLCMMYPRLRLLREFLREDGVILVSIDNNAHSELHTLMQEVFGAANHLTTFCWQQRTTRENRKAISEDHEYVIAFLKSRNTSGQQIFKLAMTDEIRARYKNPDNDPRGPWQSVSANAQAGHATASQFYELTAPNGKKHSPPEGRCWLYTQTELQRLINEDRIWFGKSGNNVPRIKKFLAESEEGVTPNTLLFANVAGTNDAAKKELIALGLGEAFETPKPTSLVRHLISIAAQDGDLIMDSFSGSGTTGHAVLDLNKQDGGHRQFILVEMDEKIAPEITAERLSRVINGYDKGGDPEKPVEGLGGGFRYCHLGTPLFNEFGDIDEAVNFPDLAAHVFFSETGAPLPKKVDGSSPLIGSHKDKIVYLLFSPAEQGFPREAAGNVLTPDALAALPAAPEVFEGERVVYAEGCTVSPERLKAMGVVFKQIPYQIEGA